MRGDNLCRPDKSLCCLDRLLFRPRPKKLLRRPEGVLYRPEDLLNRILGRGVSQRVSPEGLLCRPEGLSCQSNRGPRAIWAAKGPCAMVRGLPMLTILSPTSTRGPPHQPEDLLCWHDGLYRLEDLLCRPGGLLVISARRPPVSAGEALTSATGFPRSARASCISQRVFFIGQRAAFISQGASYIGQKISSLLISYSWSPVLLYDLLHRARAI